MSSNVWISTAPAHASNMRPLLNDWGENNPDRLQGVIERNQKGEVIHESEFPTEIFGAPHAPQFDSFPNLFNGYGYWVISQLAKDIIEQFNLGAAVVKPVKVLQKDRQTPVDGDWCCFSFGNSKTAFLPEQSPNALDFAGGRWTPSFSPKDGEMVVSEAALEGPDIWVDPLVVDAFFLSDGLARALRKSKADKGFFLKKSNVFKP